MKKILIITNHSYMLYHFRKELIQKLMEENEVVISMPYVGHEEDFQAMGIRCINTEIDRRGINPVTDMKLVRTYFQMLRREKPDLVITYSIKPNIYAGFICSMLGIPYAVNVQGLGTAFQKKGLAEMVTWMYRIALRKAKTVFFENKGNAQEFLKRHIIPKKKITVLHGAGINLDKYPYVAHEFPSEEGTVNFLYLGRIMKEKGMDELFGAFKRLYAVHGNRVCLHLVGFFEDEYKEQVEKLEAEGMVKFHGFQEDPKPYYEMADCVVLPSYHEGMSNVLLEGAATGRPLITSNIPGCREAVKNGSTGYLCEVKNEDSLYEAMELVMSMTPEDCEKMGQAGRRRMERYFAKEKVVENTVEALR